MLNHPTAAHRPYVLAYSAAGVVCSAGLALAIIGSLVSSDFWTGALGLATGIGWALIASGMAVVSGLCFRAIWRGPSTKPKTVVYSSDWPFFACLSAVTAALSTGILGALSALGEGRADSVLAAHVLITWLGLFAFPCALGAIKVGWNLVTRGRSSLRLDANPVPADQALSAVLEIPFAVDCAPMLDLSLRLTRSEAGVSSDDSSTQTVVWRALQRIETFEPVGPRRCRVRIDIDLDVPTPCDLDGRRVVYFWSLEAEPVSPDIGWNAHFDVPIQFKDFAAR
jgi:hypothetical protein